jgi:hypothetical protein
VNRIGTSDHLGDRRDCRPHKEHAVNNFPFPLGSCKGGWG